MAFVVKDRVRETTNTVGTGTLTLAGAVQGFQAFSVIGNANTTYYVIFDSASSDWEVGIGTYTSSGTTLSRDTVLSSSNSGNKVTFGSGEKDVFVAYPAEKAISIDTLPSTLTVTDRSASSVNVSLTDGYIPVTNRATTQSRIYGPFAGLIDNYLAVLKNDTSIAEVTLT